MYYNSIQLIFYGFEGHCNKIFHYLSVISSKFSLGGRLDSVFQFKVTNGVGSII